MHFRLVQEGWPMGQEEKDLQPFASWCAAVFVQDAVLYGEIG